MNKKKAIKIATASAIAASGFVAVAPAQAAVKTTNVNTVVNTAISKMAAAYDGYHKPGLEGKLPPTAKIRQLTTDAEAAYDAAVAAIAKDGGTKSQKSAFTKKLNAKKYLLTRAQGYVKAIDVNLNAAKKTLDKAVASGKAKDVKTAEAALVKTAETFEKAVKAVYGPSTRKVLVAKYHVPALAKAATVKDELTVYNAYKQIEDGKLIDTNLEKAGTIIAATKATVDKLAAGDKRDTKLVKNLLDAVAKNNAKYYGEIGPVDSITAINATTVEVKYKEAVENVDSHKYSIEGLTIASAVVKQTDNKTVILTTSTQEGAKEYTIKSGAIKVGTFKGVSAVIPTAIKVTTPSIQGTIGKEVTVKATVTVPEGQSKAGIPVTVNVPASVSGGLNGALTKEVYTDANGEASYSYTRYSGVTENVTVYPTGNRTLSSVATVYFNQALAISEVTAGNALANGSKKVYKVTGAPGSTVNVTFKENVQVTPDKLVTGAAIEDAVVKSVNTTTGALSDTNNKYPYEVTTGGVQVALVQLNSQGTATFTVTGSNATVTPIVFADGSYNTNGTWSGNGKLDATELQVAAPAVTFALSHTLGIDIKAEGVQNAAAKVTGLGDGGRDYTVTITDKDGKIAPAGTVAYVVFPQGSIGNKPVYLDGTQVVAGTSYPLTVGANGQVGFTLTGDKDGYATPTVYLNNGSSTGTPVLDSSDLQKVGEITYFVNAVVEDANLTVIDSVTKKAATSVPGNHPATFTYQSVDQNGFDYIKGSGNYEVTYQVTALFNDVTANGTPVAKGTTKSIKVQATDGKAELNVISASGLATNVNVSASASQITLPNKSASVTFTSTTAIADVYTGTIESYNKAKEQVKFEGKDSVSYKDATFKNAQGNVIDKKAFEDTLAAKTVKATYTKTTDGKVSFDIIEATGTGTPDLSLVATVSKVTTATTTGVKKVGDEVEVKVTFSDAVTVTGTPTLSSNVGNTKANYVSGDGTKELTFKYTVVKGDSTPGSTALTISGINGTIKTTTSGLSANLTVSETLAGITVDGIAPVVTGVTNNQVVPSGSTVTPTFTEGVATISKDAAAATPLTSGQVVSAAGAYVIALTDAAGNVTTVNFTIAS